MKKPISCAVLVAASQFVHANDLTKSDTAATWNQATVQEQAAFVTALAEAAGVSKKSDLRFLINCMRDLAAQPEAAGLRTEALFTECLSMVQKAK